MMDLIDPVEQHRSHLRRYIQLSGEVVLANRERTLELEQVSVDVVHIFRQQLRIFRVVFIDVLDLVKQLRRVTFVVVLLNVGRLLALSLVGPGRSDQLQLTTIAVAGVAFLLGVNECRGRGCLLDLSGDRFGDCDQFGP